ncbi:MAG TPA: hypothetical protein VFW63_00355, partial [Acidimicrobiales bacterium]|nr:hypothetical protein [Acidimicrobiales bacterium]
QQQEVDLVRDGWTYIFQDNETCRAKTPEEAAEIRQLADFRKMEEIRARVDAIVKDPVTAEALKPYYNQMCKRPCFHDEYLQAFNRPSVRLVHTDGRGVEAITERGVVAQGVEHEVDCIVWATGFEVGTEFTSRAGYDPVGRGGRRLSERWSDGMRTMHGIHVHGFPNMFMVQLTQGSNHIANVPHNLWESGETIAAIVAHAAGHGFEEVEVTAEAEEAWLQVLLGGSPLAGLLGEAGDDGDRVGEAGDDGSDGGSGADDASPRRGGLGVLGSQACTPGYYNNEGQPPTREQRYNFLGYPAGPLAFFRFIQQWRSSGRFDGLAFRR